MLNPIIAVNINAMIYKTSIQIGVSLGFLFIVHCVHYFSFKNTHFPVKINNYDVMKYVDGELINIFVPVYIFSYSTRVREMNFNNFRSYFNYHIKYILPGIIYVSLIFVIKLFDKVPQGDFLSCYLPFRFVMIVIFTYQFFIGMMMYPIVSLLNCASEDISSSEYFNSFVNNDYSGSEISDKLVNSTSNTFDSMNRIKGDNSRLVYMISNILIYFFLMNIFYYFSLESELYVIYTVFYVSIFIICSMKYIKKSTLNMIAYTCLVFFFLFIYIYSKVQEIYENDGSMFFISLLVFLSYFFIGYNSEIFNFLYGIKLYHMEIFSLIPIIYERINTEQKNIIFSPFHFPLISRCGEFILKITYSWIVILLALYNLNCSRIIRPISKKTSYYIENAPYLLILLSTAAFFICERAEILNLWY